MTWLCVLASHCDSPNDSTPQCTTDECRFDTSVLNVTTHPQLIIQMNPHYSSITTAATALFGLLSFLAIVLPLGALPLGALPRARAAWHQASAATHMGYRRDRCRALRGMLHRGGLSACKGCMPGKRRQSAGQKCDGTLIYRAEESSRRTQRRQGYLWRHATFSA